MPLGGLLRRVRRGNGVLFVEFRYFLSRGGPEKTVPQPGETRVGAEAVHTRIHIHHEQMRRVLLRRSLQRIESRFLEAQGIVGARRAS